MKVSCLKKVIEKVMLWGISIMSMLKNLKSILCLGLIVGVFLSMSSSMGKAEETFSFSRIAANAEGKVFDIEQNVEIDESITNVALSELLSLGNAIVWNAATCDYSFPLLEVEHTGLIWSVTRLLADNENVVSVVSVYPQGIPSIAASVLISESTGTVIDLFEGSTWQMSQYWEQETGKPAYFRSVSERFLFHCLFEPVNQTIAAAIPDDADISVEQALKAAEEVLVSEGLVSSSQLLGQYKIGAYFNRTNQYGKAHDVVWTVSYYTVSDEGYLLKYTVDLDGHNGKKLYIRDNSHGLG